MNPERPTLLSGGIANAGAVVRVGDEVLRPAGAHSPAVHALLRHVRSRGFEGAPEPRGLEPTGRERVSFIPGEVPLPPFPLWAQTDEVLASIAVLLRRFHDSTVGFVPPADARWDREMADPRGDGVICHNDVCPENVVFRDGVAVALLDFDFAAPGSRVFDLAALASMCVPLDAPGDAPRTGWAPLDPFARLRVAADAYGLPPDRSELVERIAESMAGESAFVQRRVEAGEDAFVKMWQQMGGKARYKRRRLWFEENREHFLDALG